MSCPVEVVVKMTVCPSTVVLTTDVSCVSVNTLTGDESSVMLPTSGLLRQDRTVSPDTQ